MNQTIAIVALIVFALLVANVSFMSEKLFFVKPFSDGQKPFMWRACELIVYYGLTALLAYVIESRFGNVHPQRWEFYASTVCVFLVLASPGFIMRYLWHKK